MTTQESGGNIIIPPDFQQTIPATPVEEAPAAQDPTPEIPAAAARKFFVGNRAFDTAEEALAFANGMNQAQAQAASALQRPAEQPPQLQKKKFGDLLFEDPEEAARQMKAEVKEEVVAEQRAIDNQKKLWEDFYLKHPDLRGQEDLVQMVLARENQLGSFEGMSVTQGAPILAQRTRERIHSLRNAPGGGQALPSTPAMVAGASGASAPRQPAPPKPVPTTFVDELRMGRQKRG